MTRVVTTTCRYKRPPKKRKPGPAIEQRIVAAKGLPLRGAAPSQAQTEEHRRRGDAADALFHEMKRRIAAAVRSGGAPPPKKP